MVFVHSRKDTVKTARQLAELAANRDGADLSGPPGADDGGAFSATVKKFQTEVNKSKNPEVKELSARGATTRACSAPTASGRTCLRGWGDSIGVHGDAGVGVNLPAHLVVIKGTTLYDPQRGRVPRSGVLDVQIFGRAGRPGSTRKARV